MLADIHLILPRVRLIPTFVDSSPYLSSSGTWSEVGEWLSLHAHTLPKNISGLHFCPREMRPPTSFNNAQTLKHIRRVSDKLQLELIRLAHSALHANVIDTASSSQSSELVLFAQRLQHAGPPVHSSLDGIALPCHRSAFASFLCADWFFGKYAKNYFAPNLLPRTGVHTTIVAEAGAANNSVCLACWHHRRQAVLEDEFHVACVCPEHDRARHDLLRSLGGLFTLQTQADLCKIMSGGDAHHMNAVGQFFVRVRQTRRRQKIAFERLSERVAIKSFACKRTALRLRGKPACRHGVLFSHLPADGCKCLSATSTDLDWQHAMFMPALDPELKLITATPFLKPSFRRLAVLQAEARRLLW